MSHQNQEVTYDITEDNHKDKFIVPSRVRETLGIADDEDPPLHITITHPDTGDILLDDVIVYNLTTGPEIAEPKTRAVIESHQRLRITVSRADAAD